MENTLFNINKITNILESRFYFAARPHIQHREAGKMAGQTHEHFYPIID